MERGEPIMKSFTDLAAEMKLKFAEFSGIGAVMDVTLGYYDFTQKTYLKKQFNENYELISCMGNITYKDGSPFVHAHVAMGDREYRLYGGHLFEATIAVVGEFSLIPGDVKVERVMNEDVELAVWNLKGCSIE